jgi:hypothetical protein
MRSLVRGNEMPRLEIYHIVLTSLCEIASPNLRTAIGACRKLIALLSYKMNTFSVRAFIPPLTRRCTPLRISRSYAVQTPGAPTLEIFSHQQKWMQKERAAANVETSRSVDYLRDEVASRLCERLMVRLFPPFSELSN